MSEMARAAGALLRQPGFALLASGTFALGVGALLGAFSLIDALVVRALPWPNHDRVVIYGGRTEDDPMRAISPRLFRAVASAEPRVSHGLAYAPKTVNAVNASHRELLIAQRVDEGFLRVLGVVAQSGVTVSATPGRTEAMLTDELWKRWFDGDPRVTGRSMIIDGEEVRIAGVLPRDYRFFGDVDLLVLPATPARVSDTAENMTAVALLAGADDVGRFSRHVAEVARRDAAALHLESTDLRWYGATRIADLVARGGAQPAWSFLTCAWLVMLLAVVNVSNLMLARRLRRAHETALQLALGASAWRTRLPSITDALIVTALAMAIGTPIGMLLTVVFRPYLPAQWVASALPPFPCARSIAATLIVASCLSLAVAICVSSARTSDAMLSGQLSMNGAASGSGAMHRVRSLLTLVQSAIATMLLVLGVTALSYYVRADRAPLGFDRSDTFVVEMRVDEQGFPLADDVGSLLAATRDAAEKLPDVDLFGWSTELPVGTPLLMRFARGDGDTVGARIALVTPGAARALGYRKLAGRWLNDGDRRGAEPVALVNEAYLRQIDGRGLNAMLRPVRAHDPPARIVGVLVDTLDAGDAEDSLPLVILPFSQAAGSYAALREFMPMYAVLRGPGAREAAYGAFAALLRSTAPSLALGPVRSLDDVARKAAASPRRDAVLFSTLAGFAVSLACVGHFSMRAFDVVARRRELAIRGALGATPLRLAASVMFAALSNALAGIALGVLAVVALRPWLAPVLPGPEWARVSDVFVAATTMVLLTMLAVLRPALRAAFVEPWRIFRSE